MNMNKKGFTLIELLAVIVILAIIAVIATPIITGIIEDAKKNAAMDSAYGVLNSVQGLYAGSMLTDSTVTLPITVTWTNGTPTTSGGTTNTITLTGTQPTTGTVTLSDTGKYCVGTHTPKTDAADEACIGDNFLVVNGYKVTYDFENQKFTTVE